MFKTRVIKCSRNEYTNDDTSIDLPCYILVRLVAQVEPILGKGSEIPVGGMLTIMHMVKKVMKMKNLGTRTQGQISMTLATKPMEAGRGAKAMAVVKIKVATAARRAEVVVVAETQEEEWEEVVLQNEERTPIIYPIRKSHFHVTVSHSF